MRTKFTVLGLLAIGVLGLGACGAVEEEFDCAHLCEEYRDCYDASYDDEACEDRCNGYVDQVSPGQADVCEACFDITSCAGAAFACGSECQGLLP